VNTWCRWKMNKLFRLFFVSFIFILAALAAAAQDVPATQDTPAVVNGDSSDIKPVDAEPEAVVSSINQTMSIRPSSKDPNLFSISLRDASLVDLFRLMAQKFEMNIMIDSKVKGLVTATLNNVSMEEVLNTITEMNNLKIEKKGELLIIKPNLISKVFVLQFVRLGDIVEVKTTTTSTASAAPSVSVSSGGASAATAGQPSATQVNTSSSFTGKNDFQRCLSDVGYVIPNVQSNSFMAVDYPENIKKIEEYVKMSDRGKEKKIIKLQYINANDLMGVK
jgi:type II secretory pathway component HofQ